MGKGSKTRARALKKLAIADRGLPELAPTPKRGKDKCFKKRTRQQGDDDPTRTVLEARCRRAGIETDRAGRQAVSGAMYCDDAGIAILIELGNQREKEDLWRVFCDLDRVEEIYHRRILQRSRHAKCGKMEFLPERFEAQAGDLIDTRSDDEKDRDASNAWAWWRGCVGELSSHDQVALWDGVYMRRKLHEGGEVTKHGRSFVEATQRLLAVVSNAKKR